MEKINLIESVLEGASKHIKEKTHGKCLGIVTSSSHDEKEKMCYSLYIHSPKIQDYSYQLISVSTNGYLNEFPVESILYAKSPKNNQYSSSGTFKEFKKNINEFINHKLTELITSHLINSANLKEEFQPQFGFFPLFKSENEYSINIDSKNRELHFNKLILTSHLSSNSSKWLPIILNSSINFECNFSLGGSIKYNLPLITLVSPNTINPVFDLNLYFPSNSDLQRFNNEKGTCTVSLLTDSEDLKIQINYGQNILVQDN